MKLSKLLAIITAMTTDNIRVLNAMIRIYSLSTLSWVYEEDMILKTGNAIANVFNRIIFNVQRIFSLSDLYFIEVFFKYSFITGISSPLITAPIINNTNSFIKKITF